MRIRLTGLLVVLMAATILLGGGGTPILEQDVLGFLKYTDANNGNANAIIERGQKMFSTGRLISKEAIEVMGPYLTESKDVNTVFTLWESMGAAGHYRVMLQVDPNTKMIVGVNCDGKRVSQQPSKRTAAIIDSHPFQSAKMVDGGVEAKFHNQGIRYNVLMNGTSRGLSAYGGVLRINRGDIVVLSEHHFSHAVLPSIGRNGLVIKSRGRDPKSGREIREIHFLEAQSTHQ